MLLLVFWVPRCSFSELVLEYITICIRLCFYSNRMVCTMLFFEICSLLYCLELSAGNGLCKSGLGTYCQMPLRICEKILITFRRHLLTTTKVNNPKVYVIASVVIQAPSLTPLVPATSITIVVLSATAWWLAKTTDTTSAIGKEFIPICKMARNGLVTRKTCL